MTRATDRLTGKTLFGTGFILNLVKFTEHAGRIDEVDDKDRQDIIERWFPVADDHLSDIEIPEVFKGTKVERLTKKLCDLSRGLRYRHDKTTTEKDIDNAIHIVRLIAMEVDKYFDLKPDIGKI